MDSLYDRALSEVGPNGIFQKNFDIIYNVILVALWAMAYMNIILALVVTPHNCQLPEKPENISRISWKSHYIPTYEDATGQEKFASCEMYINPDENNATKACDKYEYEQTWYKSTVPSEYDWVCDNELYVANVFAYSRIGETVGSIIFGWLGDVYGRRLTYILALSLIVIGRLMSILAGRSFLLFVSGCVIACLPSWSVVQSTTVISLEISSPERRTTTATLRYASWSFGTCVMPFLYWWLKDWKLFLTVITMTQLPFLFLSWNIIESPRWLWIEGKMSACVKELKRIAKTNKTKLNADTEQELLSTRSTGHTEASYGPLALFSGCTLAKNTILQLCLWVCVSMSYTVLLMSSAEKSEGNPFLEFAWQSAAEVPGNFVGAWLADNIGRRYAGVTSFSTSALMWALIVFRVSSTNAMFHTQWIGTVLVLVNRMATSVSYYTINLFNMELYPTCLRQSGMSLGNVLASGASAIAPYILYMGHRIDIRLPGAVLTGISLLGVTSSLLLPETLNAKLPETLDDARIFGRDVQSYISVHLERSQTDGEKDVVHFTSH